MGIPFEVCGIMELFLNTTPYYTFSYDVTMAELFITLGIIHDFKQRRRQPELLNNSSENILSRLVCVVLDKDRICINEKQHKSSTEISTGYLVRHYCKNKRMCIVMS